MKKLMVLALCLMLALSAVFGCAKPAEKAEAAPAAPAAPAASTEAAAESTATDKLVIWSYLNEGEPVGIWEQSVVDKYSELYPDVDVEIVFCGRDILTQFRTKLNDTDAKDFPDLISHNNGAMKPIAQEGLLLPLNDALQTQAQDQDKVWYDTFVSTLMDSLKVDGNDYFVPEGLYTSGFFYDEVMFENLGIKVPETWDEFITACETLKANGIAPLALDGALDLYNEWWFARFAGRLAGPEALHEAASGKVSFKDNPKFLEAAQYVYSMYENGYFQAGYEGSVFPAAQAQFTQGKAAMLFCGAWIPTEMSSQTPETMKMRMFTVPEIPGSTSIWAEELWGNVFGITKDAKNVENAINFLKVFSSMEVQADKAALKNPSPLVGAPAVTELANIEPQCAKATAVTSSYCDLQMYPDWFANILGPLGTKLITGVLTPEQFIDELAAQTDAFYAA